jgi:hypothetical protein
MIKWGEVRYLDHCSVEVILKGKGHLIFGGGVGNSVSQCCQMCVPEL